MKIYALLFTAVSAFLSCNKEVMQIAKSDTHVIVSGYTNVKYELKVLLPEDYDPARAYPIIYLTDAFLHFKTVAELIRKSGDEIQDVILVGIFYGDYPFKISNALKIAELRTTDLTYPVDQNKIDEGEAGGGGGLVFYQVLKDEIIFLIEQKYHSKASERTIFGHSLGGYFSLFQMLQFSEELTFPNVVALSPSVYWADLNIFRMEETINTSPIELPFTLYLGIGEQEGVQNNALFNELTHRFKEHTHSGLKYESDRYSGGHIHSAKNGFANALKYLFK